MEEVQGQQEQVNWRDQYLAGTDIYENPTLKDTPDVPTLARRLVDTKAKLGLKGLIIPKEDAAPEEWDKFHQELGRPETAEGYAIAAPEGLPEGFPYSEELVGLFRQWAFEEGLSTKAAANLFNKYLAANVENYNAAQTAYQESLKEIGNKLKEKWGENYQENFAMAQKAMRQFAPPGSAELDALDRAIGDSPVLALMFYNIGQQMGEAGLVRGAGGGVSPLETRKMELEAHPAMLKADHPEHDKVVKEYNEIIKKLVEGEEKEE